MLYLLYLIFATVEGVAEHVSGSDRAMIEAMVDRINFLLLMRISVLFVIVFIINVLVGCFFLHRLTGPLVRIKYVLNEIGAGRTPEKTVTLRKGDFPTDVSDALNSALTRINAWRQGR